MTPKRTARAARAFLAFGLGATMVVAGLSSSAHADPKLHPSAFDALSPGDGPCGAEVAATDDLCAGEEGCPLLRDAVVWFARGGQSVDVAGTSDGTSHLLATDELCHVAIAPVVDKKKRKKKKKKKKKRRKKGKEVDIRVDADPFGGLAASAGATSVRLVASEGVLNGVVTTKTGLVLARGRGAAWTNENPELDPERSAWTIVDVADADGTLHILLTSVATGALRVATRVAGGGWMVIDVTRASQKIAAPSLAPAGDGAEVAYWLERDGAYTLQWWTMNRGARSTEIVVKAPPKEMLAVVTPDGPMVVSVLSDGVRVGRAGSAKAWSWEPVEGSSTVANAAADRDGNAWLAWTENGALHVARIAAAKLEQEHAFVLPESAGAADGVSVSISGSRLSVALGFAAKKGRVFRHLAVDLGRL